MRTCGAQNRLSSAHLQLRGCMVRPAGPRTSAAARCGAEMGCTLPTKPRVALPSESAIGIKEDEIHDNYSDLDSEGARYAKS